MSNTITRQWVLQHCWFDKPCAYLCQSCHLSKCPIKDTLKDSWPITIINFVRFYRIFFLLLLHLTANQSLRIFMIDQSLLGKPMSAVQSFAITKKGRKRWLDKLLKRWILICFGRDSWQCSPGFNPDSIHWNFTILRFNSDSIQHKPDSIQTQFT